MRRTLIAVTGCTLWGLAPAVAQLVEVGPPRAQVGAALLLAQPVGAFADYVQIGGGFSFFGAWYPGPAAVLGLRLDGAFIIYGHETRTFQLVPLIDVDVSTSNNIFSLFFGPELQAPRGAVRPYASGQIGFSYFGTESSVSGTDNINTFAKSTNFDDVTFAGTAAAGLRIQLARGRKPVALDLGVRYVWNGEAEYLREGSITIIGNQASFSPIRSETNLLLYHLGVAVGLRR